MSNTAVLRNSIGPIALDNTRLQKDNKISSSMLLEEKIEHFDLFYNALLFSV